jgi:hypothetical protein
LAEPSFIVGNCNVWGDEGELIRVDKPNKLKLLDLLSLSSHFPVNPSAYFYHKSLHQKIGGYTVDEHYAMDIDFILKAVQEARVYYVDETWEIIDLLRNKNTYIYRERAANASP